MFRDMYKGCEQKDKSCIKLCVVLLTIRHIESGTVQNTNVTSIMIFKEGM